MLIWMSIEDTSVLPPVALSLIISLLIAAFQLKKRESLCASLLTMTLIGASVGLGTAFVAALLMLVKTGWHAHIFPDYPLGMILDMLRRAPAWVVAGGLIGFGMGMIGLLRRGYSGGSLQ